MGSSWIKIDSSLNNSYSSMRQKMRLHTGDGQVKTQQRRLVVIRTQERGMGQTLPRALQQELMPVTPRSGLLTSRTERE